MADEEDPPVLRVISGGKRTIELTDSNGKPQTYEVSDGEPRKPEPLKDIEPGTRARNTGRIDDLESKFSEIDRLNVLLHEKSDREAERMQRDLERTQRDLERVEREISEQREQNERLRSSVRVGEQLAQEQPQSDQEKRSWVQRYEAWMQANPVLGLVVTAGALLLLWHTGKWIASQIQLAAQLAETQRAATKTHARLIRLEHEHQALSQKHSAQRLQAKMLRPMVRDEARSVALEVARQETPKLALGDGFHQLVDAAKRGAADAAKFELRMHPDRYRGLRGHVGPRGAQGPRGESGAHGRDGRNGRDGRDGRNGRDGRQGPKGDRGRDAQDVRVSLSTQRGARTKIELDEW